MRITRPAEHRVSATPNAVMTTLASPTLSATADLSVWRVAMTAGQQGPRHLFDVEQVWVVLAGEPTVTGDGAEERLAPGDAVTFPAGAQRRIAAGGSDVEFLVCGTGRGRAVPIADEGTPGEPVVPPWVA
ncbi:cupin domain-containing protein [Pimelobacter simplex]|uniref:cupin domain-containing protein n=1 Tax=Nocardioides simplex TaxID=2045 RepID=UPI0038309463